MSNYLSTAASDSCDSQQPPCLLPPVEQAPASDESMTHAEKTSPAETITVTVTNVESPSVIHVQTKEQREACNSLIREMHKHFSSCDKEKVLNSLA